MVNLVNSWMQGIIIAVIITIIIEMILPEGKNKKYIKTVINIYIIYVIIFPICTKVFHKKIDLESVFKEYQVPKITVSTIDNNKFIKEIYEENLKEKIKQDIETMGFRIIEIDLKISEKDENYGNVEKIKIMLEGSKRQEVKSIEKININNNVNNEKNGVLEEEKKKITEYLISNYGVDNENIIIGG